MTYLQEKEKNLFFTMSLRFFFSASHTLNRDIEAEGSKRIHGHTYHVEVSFKGDKNPETGMVIDLGALQPRLEVLRLQLDHRFLDEVPNIGPATLENLCVYVAEELRDIRPPLVRVRIWREALGETCTLDIS